MDRLSSMKKRYAERAQQKFQTAKIRRYSLPEDISSALLSKDKCIESLTNEIISMHIELQHREKEILEMSKRLKEKETIIKTELVQHRNTVLEIQEKVENFKKLFLDEKDD